MAVFHGFQALRPTPEKASRVASLPYDVVSREEAYTLGKTNQDSFLHVERAEIDCPKEMDMYDEAVYKKAEENLQKMIKEGTLIEEEKRCFYIYELIRKGKSQTGLVGCCSIDDYQNGLQGQKKKRTESGIWKYAAPIQVLYFLPAATRISFLCFLRVLNRPTDRFMILQRKMRLLTEYGLLMRQKK